MNKTLRERLSNVMRYPETSYKEELEMVKQTIPHNSEQRRPGNLYLSMLVDLGVTYRRVFGAEAALDFLRTHRVPLEIAERIIFQNSLRRLTVLERRKGFDRSGRGE